MKLEKFKKNKKLKRSFVVAILVVTLGIGGIGLFKTFAWYQTEKEYNVINGAVQNFNYDVKLAVNVNGKEQTNLPKDDYDVNNPDASKTYYKVDVTCTNDVQGEWDYNAWNLKLTNLDNKENGTNGTKCKLAFNNTAGNGMSSTERDNIIKQGVQIRRNTYRGKDITEYLEDGKLFEMIKSGKFDDVYVGDYMISNTTDAFNNKKIVWLIADLDNYLNQGDTALTKHHATIIPAYKLQDSRMNPTNSTAKGASQVPGADDIGAYKGSEMYQKTLNEVYNKYIAPDFCDSSSSSDCHIIEYRNLVSTDMASDRSNQWGLGSGASSNWAWENRKLDLMSEVNVYGTTVWSSSGYDIGLDNRQYAIFQLRPELINQGVSGISDTNTGRYWYWLKAVTDSASFAGVSGDGYAYAGNASNSGGVRPRFLID